MMHARTAIPWGWVALAVLGSIGTRSTGQMQHLDSQPAAVATTELPDSPGALLMTEQLGSRCAGCSGCADERYRINVCTGSGA
jgi:hypothetical protein